MENKFAILIPEVNQGGIAFTIEGADSQILTVHLKPGDVARSEVGTMMFMVGDVKPDTECTCSLQRVCGGETCCQATFTNTGNATAVVGLTPNYPAKIVPVNINPNRHYVAQKGSFMSSLGNVEILASVDCNPCSCCCGGMGMIRQKIQGDGVAFLNAGGTVLQRNLAAGEKIVLDTEVIVAYEESVEIGIQTAGGCCTMCFGGEGLFNTTATGPGTVIIQSMPFSKYVRSLIPMGSKKSDTAAAGSN